MGILEGEGGGGAILPRLGAKVVIEAGAGGHGLGVEVGGEGAILQENKKLVSHTVMPHSFHTGEPFLLFLSRCLLQSDEHDENIFAFLNSQATFRMHCITNFSCFQGSQLCCPLGRAAPSRERSPTGSKRPPKRLLQCATIAQRRSKDHTVQTRSKRPSSMCRRPHPFTGRRQAGAALTSCWKSILRFVKRSQEPKPFHRGFWGLANSCKGRFV